MPFRLIHFDINVARAADGTRYVERLRSCGICLTVQQILSLTLNVILSAVELHESPPVSAFVNRTVDSCAGQAEGLSIVSFSCYCTDLCRQWNSSGRRGGRPSAAALFWTQCFLGWCGGGGEAGRHSGSVGAAVIVVSTQCLCLLTSLVPLLSFLCLWICSFSALFCSPLCPLWLAPEQQLATWSTDARTAPLLGPSNFYFGFVFIIWFWKFLFSLLLLFFLIYFNFLTDLLAQKLNFN